MNVIYGRYLQAIADRDTARALGVLDDALIAGVPPHRLITEVLAKAQRAVGEKWARGEWTVADEHAATAVTQQALTAVAPPRARTDADLRVVIACAEGEWHSLPAQMAGELLREEDVDVTVLGANTTVDKLRHHLRGSAPDVLALSATMPTSLLSGARSIAAARAEGVPVVVGGSAWGSGQHRARALGAHLRLDDIRDVRARLDEVLGMRPPPLPDLLAEVFWLDDLPDEAVRAAYDLSARGEDLGAAGSEPDLAEWEEDQRWAARYAAAAVACDDPSVVDDFLEWTLLGHRKRQVPEVSVLRNLLCLADVIEASAPRGAAILRLEVAAVGPSTGSILG